MLVFRGMYLVNSQSQPYSFSKEQLNDQNSFTEGITQNGQVNSAEILKNEKGCTKLRGKIIK